MSSSKKSNIFSKSTINLTKPLPSKTHPKRKPSNNILLQKARLKNRSQNKNKNLLQKDLS
jgi:hypothetical protein